MNYLFYSVIGKHASESVDEIIRRKANEIQLCGFSLWSAKIDRQSIMQVSKLSEEDDVYVLCKVNKNAKDPVISGKFFSANKMVYPTGEVKPIPSGINTTFTKGKNYQAYVVESYNILDEEKDFNFGPYETLLADNSVKTFSQRFKCFQFQNTFGKINPSIDEICKKKISVIMKLKYPFVVNIY